MLIITTETIPGQRFTPLGMVHGSTVQCKNLGHDLFSGLQNLVGGEMDSYTDMMNEARQIATKRMVAQAENLHADAVVAVRYATSAITQGAAEIMVYGTAVKFED